MVKHNRESFVKRQKEIKRKQKAQEKIARRQGKVSRVTEEETVLEEAREVPFETES